jgi:hypothetical protein
MYSSYVLGVIHLSRYPGFPLTNSERTIGNPSFTKFPPSINVISFWNHPLFHLSSPISYYSFFFSDTLSASRSIQLCARKKYRHSMYLGRKGDDLFHYSKSRLSCMCFPSQTSFAAILVTQLPSWSVFSFFH